MILRANWDQLKTIWINASIFYSSTVLVLRKWKVKNIESQKFYETTTFIKKKQKVSWRKCTAKVWWAKNINNVKLLQHITVNDRSAIITTEKQFENFFTSTNPNAILSENVDTFYRKGSVTIIVSCYQWKKWKEKRNNNINRNGV